ncbi:MAG: transposase [Actinomycetota bacterium]|nr:transposase [Actinomycetota bacterium]
MAYLNGVSDQLTGFFAIVVPGTIRDSLYILDGLLEHDTGLEPRIMPTTARSTASRATASTPASSTPTGTTCSDSPGSLHRGTVRASQILRVLQGQGRPTSLGRALAEYGRIAKTMHLLAVLSDDPYRRDMSIWFRCKSTNTATASAATSSTANAEGCASATAKAKKTNSPRSASSSTPSSPGTPPT